MSRKSIAKFLQWVKVIGHTNPIMNQAKSMFIEYYGEDSILSNHCSKECDVKRNIEKSKALKKKTQVCVYCNEPSYTSNAKVCSKNKFSICNQKSVKVKNKKSYMF